VTRARVLALLTVCIALFLALLDSTAISVVLPLMARDLHTGISGLQWTAECYVLLMAGFLLTSGTLGDRIGRKQVFLAGVLLFMAGSVVSATAGSLAPLFVGRAIQGLGAAGMSPQTMAIIGATFPGREERARAMGIWSGTSGLALVLGPVIGGVLADHWGWQSVFWINVPLGAAALVLGAISIGGIRSSPARRIEVPGQIFAIGTLVALAFAIIDAGNYPWGSVSVLGPFVAAVVLAAAFAATERRSSDPMLPPALFRSRTYVASTGVLFCVAFGMYASFFLISLELQQGHGLSTEGAGLRLLPAMAAAVVAAPLAGWLASRVGERVVVMAGTGAAGVSLLALGLINLAGPYGTWWPLLVLLGLGIGSTFAPTNSALLSSVPPDRSSVASAIGQLCQQAGTAVGIGVLGTTAAVAIRSSLAAGLPQGSGRAADAASLAHQLIEGTARLAGGGQAGVSPRLLQSALASGAQHGLLVGAAAFLCSSAVAALFATHPTATRQRDPATADDNYSSPRSSHSSG
jgi:EmrB/QacA subfamily drug resistance transporter